MKRSISVYFLTVLFLFSFSASAYAGEFGDLKKKTNDARDSLLSMLKNKDRRGAEQQKLVKDTADAVSAQLAKMKAPAGKEGKFKELVDTWNAFKKTREHELVPLILSGKQEDAEKLGGGVQKGRIKKVMELCDELDK
ncbi:MAG: hypothetical protein HZB80_02915 [Deltaproteobacteria bacterium]|nr:hypothetical protein [Deltaproteobacteria bacterium]